MASACPFSAQLGILSTSNLRWNTVGYIIINSVTFFWFWKYFLGHRLKNRIESRSLHFFQCLAHCRIVHTCIITRVFLVGTCDCNHNERFAQKKYSTWLFFSFQNLTNFHYFFVKLYRIAQFTIFFHMTILYFSWVNHIHTCIFYLPKPTSSM